MAKTGTSAITAGLREADYGPVFQVHDLDPLLLAKEERSYHWSGRPWRNWDAQVLLRRPATSSAPWRVISLVREPIAQSVSAFFQSDRLRGGLGATAALGALVDQFGDRLDRVPLRWFESHLEPSLGIDVYREPFDSARGYQIIKTPAVELLLLRSEGLDAAPAALAELLGARRPIPVPRRNVGADKDYAVSYAAFRDTLRPSNAALDRAYSSRVVRHFYTPEEIEGFREHWGRRGEPDGGRPAVSPPGEAR